MAQTTRAILKNFFLTGLRPNQSNFEDLIDSSVNFTEDKADGIEALDSNNHEKYLTPKTGRLLVNPLIATREPVITVGNADDYWSGNKTFQNLGAKVRTVVLEGLTIGSDVVLTATDNLLVGFAKLQAQISSIKANYRLRTQYIILNNDYSLTNANSNSVTLQKMFNATTNGAFTLVANKKYKFHCRFGLTGMSSSVGNFSFGFLNSVSGTAVISASFNSVSVKSASYPAASEQVIIQDILAGVSTALVTNNPQTKGSSVISGIINCTTGGTLIPAFALGVGVATPNVVKVVKGSYFEIEEIGSSADVSNGAWS